MRGSDHAVLWQSVHEPPRPPGCFIFPELLAEGLEPHHVREVWLHGSSRSDTFVDIAPTLPVKIQALRQHRSQLGDWDPTAMLKTWAREQGKRKRLRAAEAFRRMILED